MESPQFKGSNTCVFDQKISLEELGGVDQSSMVALHSSQLLMSVAIFLILLNNLNIIAPGSYFGAFSWVTVVVFSIGLTINFLSIPSLYISSLKNFKREIDFWNKETFWILPLFFFGTFFLYNSRIASALALLALSVFVIALIHIKFFWEARKIIKDNVQCRSLSDHGQYFLTMQYLTAYYVLLIVLLFMYDPIMHIFTWIRLHS